MTHSQFRAIGIATLAGIIAVVTFAFLGSDSISATRASRAMASFVWDSNDRVSASDPSRRLRSGDPIFSLGANGDWQQVGFVQQRLADSDQVQMAWYGESAPQEFQFTQHRQSGSLQQVVATMLPPEKQKQIQRRLTTVMQQHGEEISAAMMPLVEDSLRRSLPIVEQSFRESVARHRSEIDALGQRLNQQIVQERLVPLAKEELLPIVRRHGQPEAEAIGRELWDRASLWRFGWRAVLDSTPIPRKGLVQEEWERFVEEEAVPVVEAHTDELVAAVQATLRDVAANPTVRSELSEVAEQLTSDPESRDLVRKILRETVVDNPALRKAWKEVWTSPEAKAAMDMAGDRLEPVVRQIGDDLFGTRETGINPDFARVLRHQILGKDRRWIVATRVRDPDSAASDPTQEISIGTSRELLPYPVVYVATDERPVSDGS